MRKRIFDIVGAVIGLIVFAPLMLIIVIFVKCEGGGPVFFSQKRLGLNGVHFNLIKFRTMVDGAETMGTGLFSYANDPRITKVGRFLRETSLDELPQLFNVIKGDISLVGPRPPVTYELGEYSDFTEKMKIRFQVKPGITGLAQVSGRNSLCWDQKIEFDNKYVELYKKWGLILDLKLIAQTIWVVITRENVVEEPAEGEKS